MVNGVLGVQEINVTDKFDDWYHNTHSYRDDENHNGAMEAWDYKQEQLEYLIKRIETHPCCLSCYSTTEEMYTRERMKDSVLRILKGEV